MKRLATLLGIIAVACLCLARTSPALALEPEVKDDAKFFSDETLTKANDQIKEIKNDHGKDLMIETFSSIPDDLKTKWEAAKDDPDRRKTFFSDWLNDRAKKLGVDGVYVLIVKDPGHLEVKAGIKTRQKAFTQKNQDKLRDILLEAFKAKTYDDGLLQAVQYFGDTLKANLGGVKAQTSADTFHGTPGGSSGSPAPPSSGSPTASSSPPAGSSPTGVSRSSSPFSGSKIMWIIFVIIAAVVIVRILSSLGGSRNTGGPGYGQGPGPNYGGGYGGGYGQGYGGGGGGGFFRNFLGGMFGGAAGSYFYDRMAHRNDPNNQFPPPTGGASPGPQDSGGSSGGDFGSSSSGGDFGSSSSGGDFGSSSDSSSSSGGDFGSSSSASGSSGGDSGGSSGGDF